MSLSWADSCIQVATTEVSPVALASVYSFFMLLGQEVALNINFLLAATMQLLCIHKGLEVNIYLGFTLQWRDSCPVETCSLCLIELKLSNLSTNKSGKKKYQRSKVTPTSIESKIGKVFDFFFLLFFRDSAFIFYSKDDVQHTSSKLQSRVCSSNLLTISFQAHPKLATNSLHMLY